MQIVCGGGGCLYSLASVTLHWFSLFQLLKQLEPLDIQLKDEVTDILSRLSKGEDIKFDSGDDLIKQGTKKFVRYQN